jgi:hypothetical protein
MTPNQIDHLHNLDFDLFVMSQSTTLPLVGAVASWESERGEKALTRSKVKGERAKENESQPLNFI